MTLRMLRDEWTDRMSTSDFLSQMFHDHGLDPLSAWLDRRWLWWDRRHRTRRARRAYFAGDEIQTYILWERLFREADPAERARLLRAAAGCEYVRSVAHTPAFGPDPNADEPGRDVAESDLFSSQLLYLLADIEECVATGADLQQGQMQVAGFSVWSWGVAVHMASTPDLPERHAMLADLYDAVHPLVGGQAAEVLACIPAPDCPPLRPYVPPVERPTATTV